MIMIGCGEKKYPWFMKKLDSTHLWMSNNLDGLNYVIPNHIAQYIDTTYYNEVRSWLKGGTTSEQLNGKEFFGIG